MRSPILNQCAGRGYNSPIKQVNMQTKLKDVPGELINSGKKIVNNVTNKVTDIGNRISNATVGEALNVTGIAYGIPPGTLVPKEKKLMKTFKRISKKNN